ncbi:MAG: hypothetical protein HUJ68_14100 [Clostridia bacterium]|nr:hypothetical protein [Clostridia bacterium]
MFDTKEAKKPIVFVDIDDTLCNTRKAFGSLYKEITGDSPLEVRGTGIKDYTDICPLWSVNEIEKVFQTGYELYNRAEPVPGAIEGIKKLLSKGYDVRVVSMYSETPCIIHKQFWIKKYFPELMNRLYFLDLNLEDKDVFVGRAIIDDDIKNIKYNKSSYPVLLDINGVYDNKNFNGIKKCKTWSEINNIL